MRRSDKEVSDFEAIEEIIKEADVCRIALATDNIRIWLYEFGYTNDPDQLLYFIVQMKGENWK